MKNLIWYSKGVEDENDLRRPVQPGTSALLQLWFGDKFLLFHVEHFGPPQNVFAAIGVQVSYTAF